MSEFDLFLFLVDSGIYVSMVLRAFGYEESISWIYANDWSCWDRLKPTGLIVMQNKNVVVRKKRYKEWFF